MVQMKDEKQIGDFIKEKLARLNMKPIDLAEALAEAKGDYTKSQLRDLVYKWINGRRKPGTDYIYYLSKILKVSIEEILVAGEVCEKYENRPYTLYSIAKSGDFERLNEIMQVKTPDGTVVGANYDEYDKTIIDYAIEFENIDLINYMVDKKYIEFIDFGPHLYSWIRIGNVWSPEEMVLKMLRLAVKYDDVKLFSRIVTRETPLWRIDSFEGDIYKRERSREGLTIENADIIDILNTKKIFDYVTTSYIPTLDDWKRIDGTLASVLGRNKKGLITNQIFKVPRLPIMFNLLLDTALSTKHETACELLKVAKRHNDQAHKELTQFFSAGELTIDQYGNYRQGHYGSLSVVGRVQKTTFDAIKGDCEEIEILSSLVGE